MMLKKISEKLKGKQLYWSPYFRVYCDGGQPNWYWLPKFSKKYYDPNWGLYGFQVYWLGREFNFSFGEDTKGLYKK
jgi:hypothetical protein